MDRDHFDALTRLLGAAASRRAALAGLAAALTGTAASAKGGNRGKPRKRRGRVRAQQVPANCFTNTRCAPGAGKNLSKCDYAGASTLAGKNLKGANLTSANLLAADASGADLRGVNLGGACLTNADLSGATVNSSTNASTARYCGTIMPDGAINDRDCGRPTRCCEACTPSGFECNDESAPCCDGSVCQEGTCVVGNCVASTDCAQGEICCNNECLAGVCCTEEECRPRGNQCVSAGGGPTQCLCGLAPSCNPGLTCCPPVAGPSSEGECVNTQTSVDHCGTCGNDCGADARCTQGACVSCIALGETCSLNDANACCSRECCDSLPPGNPICCDLG